MKKPILFDHEVDCNGLKVEGKTLATFDPPDMSVGITGGWFIEMWTPMNPEGSTLFRDEFEELYGREELHKADEAANKAAEDRNASIEALHYHDSEEN
jgi:hypothetical protein